MHWSILAAVFCLITSTECSNPALRSHNNGPDWISDCYDHAPNHLMNPFCPTQGCLAPEVVAHAQMDYNITFYVGGSKVTYTCDPFYEMVGPPTITCIQDPTKGMYVWTPGPRCNKKVYECGPLPQISNGKHSETYNRTVNATVAYTCDRGYKLTGQETITCVLVINQSTANWSQPPSCVLTNMCPTIPTVDNGSPHASVPPTTTTTTTTTITTTTTPDFTTTTEFPDLTTDVTTEGPTDANTTASGNENGSNTTSLFNDNNTTVATVTPAASSNTDLPVEVTTTTTVATPTPVVTTSKPNGLSADKYEPGTSVTYQCNQGYAFRDSNSVSVVCQGNATWSKLPECVKDCGKPNEIENGSYTLLTGKTIVGSEAHYACSNNFSMTGGNETRCLPSGNWSNLPECTQDCGKLYDPNGNFSLGNLCNNSQCFCDINKCECGDKIYYNNTERICNETNEQGFRLVCNEKFQLVGDEFIKCQRNLTWTAQPYCECIRKSVDMVFMIDSSGSVGVDGFNQTKEFLINMMNRFPADRTRFGLMFFSDQVTISFHLKTFLNDTESMIEYIRNISYEGGATHTYEALQVTRDTMFTEQNGMRLNASHIAILVSDGLSNDINRTIEQARLLKESGVTLYAVGVGDFADNQQELKTVASNEKYLFTVDNYATIDKVTGPLADATCSVSTEDEYPE